MDLENKIGERIKLRSGKTVETAQGETCSGCYFCGTSQFEGGPATDCNDIHYEAGPCHQDFRTDNTSVIFKLVTDETESSNKTD